MTYSAFSNELFEAIFGAPERKGLKLELYNALSGSEYTNADEIDFARAEHSFYIGKDYDASFLLHGDLQPFELEGKEGALNPRLSLYMFVLALHCIGERTTEAELDKKKNTRVSIPALITLYNGKEDSTVPSVHFEDNFMNSDSGDLKATVHIEDIRNENDGELGIAKKCKPLADYAIFMRSFCDSRDAGTDSTVAIAQAIQELPDGAVKQYLMSEDIMRLSAILSSDEDAE